jgi:hypothetical protein
MIALVGPSLAVATARPVAQGRVRVHGSEGPPVGEL